MPSRTTTKSTSALGDGRPAGWVRRGRAAGPQVDVVVEGETRLSSRPRSSRPLGTAVSPGAAPTAPNRMASAASSSVSTESGSTSPVPGTARRVVVGQREDARSGDRAEHLEPLRDDFRTDAVTADDRQGEARRVGVRMDRSRTVHLGHRRIVSVAVRPLGLNPSVVPSEGSIVSLSFEVRPHPSPRSDAERQAILEAPASVSTSPTTWPSPPGPPPTAGTTRPSSRTGRSPSTRPPRCCTTPRRSSRG